MSARVTVGNRSRGRVRSVGRYIIIFSHFRARLITLFLSQRFKQGKSHNLNFVDLLSKTF